MDEKRKAVLVNVSVEKDAEEVLEELERLADTAGYVTLTRMVQKKDRPDAAYFIGTGKLEELKALALASGADTVIFDNDITGSQFHNLEDFLNLEILDRATLILKIFAAHATSNEGKLQVELAYKKHSLPRILGIGTVLSRQGGGGGGGGGARRGGGEQQSELNKRTIRIEIRNLETRIKKLEEERRLRREKRSSARAKTVSIVGYTNAGKSTLMNALTKANVLAEDKLFATLDPVARKLWLEHGKEFILIDTVGFISRLPHEFIDAFKSTLEETKYSDLILHVVNAASCNAQKEYDVVVDVLKSIGAGDIPVITVLNKCDAAHEEFKFAGENTIKISAKFGEGIDKLKQKISEALFDK